jgi:hypothetical protein
VDGALANGIEGSLTLFMNIEPDACGFGPLPAMGNGLRGVVELTERILTSRLPELLPAVQRARGEGWGVALDDVGADTRSLALMPLLRPDVIKLDLSLVQEQPTPEIAAIAGAVGAQADRTGATVVAEGIETSEQAEYARALGATLGQGFYFGRPSPEPRRGHVTAIPLPIFTATLPHPTRTPFDLAGTRRPVRRGTMPLLASITEELERQALVRGRTALLVSSFPDVRGAQARVDPLPSELAENLGFVVTLAAGLPPILEPGVRGAGIDPDDPLQRTWNVIVISAHFASMLAARQHGEAEAGVEQEFDFVFTYDRDLIVECAQALMLRAARSGSAADTERWAGTGLTC